MPAKHICPHCGATYRIAEGRSCRRPAYHTAVCSFCGDVMAEWRGCARHYHRLTRPRPALQASKIVAEAAAGKSRFGKALGKARRRAVRANPVSRPGTMRQRAAG